MGGKRAQEIAELRQQLGDVQDACEYKLTQLTLRLESGGDGRARTGEFDVLESEVRDLERRRSS